MTFRDAVSHLLVSEGLLALAISRLEDGDMNSRGLSSPRYFNVRILVASERRESATLTARPRLPDAISFPCQLFHGFKNPRLFALRASRLPDGCEPLSNER